MSLLDEIAGRGPWVTGDAWFEIQGVRITSDVVRVTVEERDLLVAAVREWAAHFDGCYGPNVKGTALEPLLGEKK